MKELVDSGGDILCLQEMDQFDFFNDPLVKHGYRGCYLKRTGRRKDGCAIFYKEQM